MQLLRYSGVNVSAISVLDTVHEATEGRPPGSRCGR